MEVLRSFGSRLLSPSLLRLVDLFQNIYEFNFVRSRIYETNSMWIETKAYFVIKLIKHVVDKLSYLKTTATLLKNESLDNTKIEKMYKRDRFLQQFLSAL